MKTQLCIIRHGETDWNLEKRIQGHVDIPLNETGRAQAKAMAFDASMHKVHFSYIYSSDLSRAHETANTLATRCGLEVTTREELRERNFGIFQGILKAEASQQYPDAYKRYAERDIQFDFETGESLQDFDQRVQNIFEWIARHHQGETLAIVCHAGLLDIMYRRAKNLPLHTAREFAIPNCTQNWFHYDGSDWHLDAWADHHYLNKVMMDSIE